MPKIDHFQKKYLYFNGACEGKSCPLNLVPMWIVRKTHKNFCYDKARSLREIEYFLGVVALLFNLVIIATILSSISLIKKTSMFLTAHLALGDLFLSLFSLTIAAGHGIKSDAGIRQWRQHQCPFPFFDDNRTNDRSVNFGLDDCGAVSCHSILHAT